MQLYLLYEHQNIKSSCLCSLVDSSQGGAWHGGMVPLEQQYQLFASSGAIRFPIEPVTEAWKEKVMPDNHIPAVFILLLVLQVLMPVCADQTVVSIADY